MKKMVGLFLTLLLVLLLPVSVLADKPKQAQPHPDEFSGKLSNYEGKWIINGKTEQDTNWNLEITADSKYRLYNEYQDITGDIVFTPGHKEWDKPDTLWFDFDPALEIQFALENWGGGLVEVTGQDLIFVRPGNKVDIIKAQERMDYPRERMLGDWVLDHIGVHMMGYEIETKLYNEDIMSFSETGDEELILSFEDGIVYAVSVVLGTRFPLTRYQWFTKNAIYFEAKSEKLPMDYKFVCVFLKKTTYNDEQMFMNIGIDPPLSQDVVIDATFVPITSIPKEPGKESDE